ncbi:MAG: hypothetical protein WC807_10985 [Hyphomicrobium sp.]|jgi:hypothetical protein
MLTNRVFAAFSIAAVMAAAGFATDANAQANCDTYGKLALQQQKENEAKKCGFGGAEWSPDLKAHIAWCSGVGPDQWKVQLQKRKQQLDGCKAK